MRFLIDAQLPPALAQWLGEHGLPASPIRSLGLRDSDDGSIWNFALGGNWIVITKDEDFVSRCTRSSSAPTVIWLRIGNCTNKVLFSSLESHLPSIKRRLASGEKIIEVPS